VLFLKNDIRLGEASDERGASKGNGGQAASQGVHVKQKTDVNIERGVEE